MKPLKYQPSITIDDDFQYFEGFVIIDVESTNEINCIELGAKKNLTIKNSYLNNKQVDYSRTDDKILIKCDEIPKELKIEFRGEFNDDTKGIFIRDNCIITQCEPTYASHIFPCFDNPQNRIQISLTLEYNKKYDAISNTPSESIEEKDDKIIKKFKETLPIPIYLFAFVVGNFDIFEERTKRGLPIKVYCISDMSEYCKSIITKLAETVDVLEKYTEKILPLEVLQFFVFSGMTGMENFGLIIYGPNRSLSNLKTAKESTKRDAFSVFVHELFHHWFSCLVTISNFEHVWIKEGLTTFMTRIFTNNDYLEREFLTVYKRNTQTPILYDDNFYNVDTSYNKASTLFHLLFSLHGPDKFRQKIINIVKENYFGDIDIKKLCYHMDIDKENLSKWLHFSGMPCVYYDGHKLKKDCDYDLPIIFTDFEKDKKELLYVKDNEIEYEASVIDKECYNSMHIIYSYDHLMKISKFFEQHLISETHLLVLLYSCLSHLDSNIGTLLLQIASKYESKSVTSLSINLMLALCNNEIREENIPYLFEFFDSKGKAIGSECGVDKFMKVIDHLQKVYSKDEIVQSMQGKFGKNVLKQVRNRLTNPK